MTDAGTAKSKPGSLDAKEEQLEEGRFTSDEIKQHVVNDLDEEEKRHDGEHRANERIVQQDLNQGMDTGTHSSVHRGVNWKPKFQVHSTTSPKLRKKDDQTRHPSPN
jgi:hypothetical protein